MGSSFLGWVDHDGDARERSLRILALFQERESRDELGLGAVRDSIADQLFPGTSTIQTRLRYFLFVPWIYKDLEDRVSGGRLMPAEFAARARRDELALIKPLLEQDPSGVFGRLAGKDLKRLPSSVYWAGLGAWGLRLYPGSIDDYHRQIGQVVARRSRRRGSNGDEPDADPLSYTWRPKMPAAPDGFPATATLALTREEALFLRDRIAEAQPDSLLAYLALHGRPTEVAFPWEHPDSASFRPHHRELLNHARRFSGVMHGAAILYNVLLANKANLPGLVDEHRARFMEWADGPDPALAQGWSLDEFWVHVIKPGHAVTTITRQFVTEWVRLVLGGPRRLLDHAGAQQLIIQREIGLKQARSRFRNERALKQWSGYAGLDRLSYRWRNVTTLLADLYSGLESA